MQDERIKNNLYSVTDAIFVKQI